MFHQEPNEQIVFNGGGEALNPL